MAKMSENSIKILNYLKEQGVGVESTTKSTMEALGLEKPGQVTGVINSLVKKELVERHKETREDAEGKTKEISVFSLTEAGADFDPDADAE